jgi:predicted phage terminase large subunit-like protein
MLDLKKLKQIPLAQRKLLKRMCQINLARKNFYFYCKVRYPDIYTEGKPYLKDVCTKLQLFYENKLINKKTGKPYIILHLNMPPRFFKSFTISRFEEWIMGNDPSRQVITSSYNNKLSAKFARGVRDGIDASPSRSEDEPLTFVDIFGLKLKKGHSAVQEWSLDHPKAHLSFMATSFNSTLTGFGCNGVFCIDDQINNAEEAKDIAKLNDQYYWVCNTALSRMEGKSKLICVFTRWTNEDICGRMMQDEYLKDQICVIKYEAMNLKTGELLCEEILDLQKYNLLKTMQDPHIFYANYHQVPIDDEGRQFKVLKQYKVEECNFSFTDRRADVRVIIDPTDGKNDFICGVAYLVHESQAYIIDIYHTNKPELIEPEKLARWIASIGNVKKLYGETNKNRQFILDVKELLKTKYDRGDIILEEIYSTMNKQTKIEEAAWWIQQSVFFPQNWNIRWKDFHDHVYNYQRNGKNKYDDAPDTLSMIKGNVYNIQLAKQVFGFAVPHRQFKSLEEQYFYGK